MGLSLYEQETVIRYNQEDDVMEIYTAYPPLMRKLSACDEYSEVRADKAGGKVIAKTFTASKKMLTLRTKKPTGKPMTEEQKEAARQRMLELRAKGKL